MSKIMKLNIGNIDTPVIDGGWVDVTPYLLNIDDLDITRKAIEDEIYWIDEFSGSPQFKPDVFNAIKTLFDQYNYKFGIKIFETTETFEGYYFIQTLDEGPSIIKGRIEAIDAYAEILRNLDNAQNILQTVPRVLNTVDKKAVIEQVSCEKTFSYPTEQDSCAANVVNMLDAGFFNTQTRATSCIDAFPSAKGWIEYQSNYDRQGCSEDDTMIPVIYTHIFKVITTWKRQIIYTLDIGGEKNPPDGYIDLNESVVINGKDYHKYAKVPYSAIDSTDFANFIVTGVTINYAYWTLDISSYDDSVEYTRNRLLTDVLKFLIGFADSSLTFEDTQPLLQHSTSPYDETVQATDSFYYLKTKEVGPEYPLRYLTLAGISDIDLSEGDEKDTPATICNLNLAEIFEFIKTQFKIYWKITSSKFFLKHITEVFNTFSQGSNPEQDLTTFQGGAWSANVKKYRIITDDKYNRLKRVVTAFEIDHQGVDMLFPKLDGVFDKTKEFQLSKIFTDVWGVQNVPGSYPVNSANQLVMFATTTTTGSNKITEMLNSGYTTFNYDHPTTTITAILTGGGLGATTLSNVLDVAKGALVRVNINMALNNGVMPYLNFYGQDFNLIGGDNIFYVQLTQTSEVIRLKNNTGEATNFTAILTVVQVKYRTLETEGALSGQNTANALISVSGCDENYLQHEMPVKEGRINEEDITFANNQLQFDKELIEIRCPIKDQTKVPFDELVRTEAGDLIPVSLKVPLNNEHATFIGRKR